MKPPRSRSGSSKKDTGPKRIPGKALKSAAAPGAADATQDASTSQTARNKVVTLRTARGRTTAQQRWLNRQLNDPYVAAARKQGWRSRAAFKLIEIDDRFHIIKPGARVIDLGAAPGGWSQVAVKRGAGHIAGVDLLPVDPVSGAEIIEGDFTDPEMPDRLKEILGGPADLVMSDMAPNTTGHAATDHMRIMGLAEGALDFAMQVLAEGGSFVAKVFQGGSEKQMLDSMKLAFASVKHVKPPASRKESSELYVIATGFRPERLTEEG
ncbi:ribosomal RNA large subunit 23S methyltransferase RrmJ/FtsJ [Gluconobacter thailandicus F149-1 = NBRC 100600]|uniref:Ribosomal RNA large subunit methyltransferase E n=2 Tax=Gluconobacter thailandicus TaxID=257438 RepID=A0AAJ0QJP2_GLUTH|nr:RlmE family RNA methyltransferase [Gluconobacter thailandicus]GAN91063.1 ribosomal RNA large subunit 23S methyltransferase RrmJ/FtsJ [Gluconobacter frateurii M-2]KXV34521.1 rRNA methyltransferase [Gluconobacter thailandicus]KXV52943.1 rRNA methyltransferase [Gluconobacter thailandicus]QEH97202.1 RlmE family RNA methyltransferase [Gluconobacter thailandicus]GAC86695.1 ribosomal RNA large subunit methyltransferase J [Gluconobacter thailandicus NBRC 3255]